MIDALAPVEILEEVDSTMLEARRRAERGETAPAWLIARRQTAGRGRRGRSWLSFEGNLMTTYYCITDRPLSEVALLGFAAGVAIAETFKSMGVSDVSLKWPNDVLIGGAKAAGILIDSGARPGGVWIGLAFGVNLANAPEAIDQPTRCLRDVLPPDAAVPTPEQFLGSLRPRLEAWAGRTQNEGFEPLRRAWLALAHGVGARARVAQGDVVLEGRMIGLSPCGELELDTAEGRRLVAAGDVYFTVAA
ncbi:MAG: biotin--[acetyl-CoA-carboxylase] ligase [Hyphomonadaceae bacterium]|nr:biotin--[acetyl-CoA-carboxylase] ligase [Hyphomonadaceae bacterium]